MSLLFIVYIDGVMKEVKVKVPKRGMELVHGGKKVVYLEPDVCK